MRTEGLVPVAVIAIVLVASVISWLPGTPASAGPIGDTTADFGSEARIALGGGTAYRDGATAFSDDLVDPGTETANGAVADPLSAVDLDGTLVSDVTPPQITGAFRADGTLLKPIAVNTSVADGKDLLRSYKVRQGDTLTGIANRFGVSMMTIWWANKLSAKDDLVVGQSLTIPPVNGLVYSVKEGDTLESLAAQFKVAPDEVYETNGLEDRALLVGQTLILPGAVGKAIGIRPSREAGQPAPAEAPVRVVGPSDLRRPTAVARSPGPSSVVATEISQYFHYGHYGLDIAADYGSRVRLAAGGTVVFAGWKSNGGGYQVWIAHGSGLYTTYNHMSGVSVGRGQHVWRGQQVGRIGVVRGLGHRSAPPLRGLARPDLERRVARQPAALLLTDAPAAPAVRPEARAKIATMFLDRVKIWVRAGDGGDGAATFRQEAHVPRVAPMAATAVEAVSINLLVDAGQTTLRDFRYSHRFKATPGGRGTRARRHGKAGDDLVITVPPGTAVYDDETGALLADLVATGEKARVAKGGRGGLGNVHFKSSAHRRPSTPRRASPARSAGLAWSCDSSPTSAWWGCRMPASRRSSPP